MMYVVQVHSRLYPDGRKVKRYLHFEAYSTAAGCIFCLLGRELSRYNPDDYFEAAEIHEEPKGEILNNESIETDHVLNYL